MGKSGCPQEIPPEWIRAFSFSVPVTAALAAWFTHRTTRNHSISAGGKLSEARVFTLEIVMLPLLAALMSSRSSIRLLMVSVASFWKDPSKECESHIEYYEEMVKTNAAISQLYTASAIQSFGRLCASVVRYRSAGPLTDNLVFVLIYVYFTYVDAAYLLFAAFAKVLMWTAAKNLLDSFEVAMHQALTALHFIISSAAIYNLVVFEHRHGEKLHDISPKLKFFSTKVLLTFEYINTGLVMVVKAYANLSEVHQGIFTSTLMCVEMAVLSIFYTWCWNAQDAWYDEVSGSESRELPRVELAKCTTPSESTAQSVEATQESRQVAESLLASKGLTTMASI